MNQNNNEFLNKNPQCFSKKYFEKHIKTFSKKPHNSTINIYRFIFITILSLAPIRHAQADFQFKLEQSQFYQGYTSSPYNFEVHYSYNFEFQPNFTMKFEPGVFYRGTKNYSSEDTYFDPRELYLQKEFLNSTNILQLRMGYFQMEWAGTDIINPFDIASMKDDSDPLQSRSLSSPGLQLEWNHSPFNFMLTYIPEQTKIKSYGSDNPWLPRQSRIPIYVDDTEILIPKQTTYEFLPRETLNSARLHNFAALLQTQIYQSDLHIGYYEGQAQSLAQQAILSLNPIQVSPKYVFSLIAPIQIQPIEYRIKTSALYFNQKCFDMFCKIAIRDDLPLGMDTRIPQASRLWVFGIEKQFLNINKPVILVVEAVGKNQNQGKNLLAKSDIFERASLIGLKWLYSEALNLDFGHYYSYLDGSQLFSISSRYGINENWAVLGGWQNLSGKDNKLFGVLDDRDRIYISLEYLN